MDQSKKYSVIVLGPNDGDVPFKRREMQVHSILPHIVEMTDSKGKDIVIVNPTNLILMEGK